MNDRNEYSGFSYARLVRLYLITTVALCTPAAGIAFSLAERVFSFHLVGGIAYLAAGVLASIVALGAGFYYWRATECIFSVWAKFALAVSTMAAIWGVFQLYSEYSLGFAMWIAFWAFLASIAIPSFSFNVCARWSRHEFGVPLAAGIFLYFMLDYFKYGVPTASVEIFEVVLGIFFALGIILMVTVLLGALSHIVVLIACIGFVVVMEPHLLITTGAFSTAFVWTLVFFGIFLAVVSLDFFTRYEFVAFADCRTTEKGRDLIKRFQEGYVPDFSMFRWEGWT